MRAAATPGADSPDGQGHAEAPDAPDHANQSTAPDLSELIRSSRSVRRFAPAAVSRRQLLRLIDDALLTPSAGNKQPVRFAPIASDDARRAPLFATLRWAGYLNGRQSDEGSQGRHWPDWPGPDPDERPSAYVVMTLPSDSSHFAYVDLGIVAQTLCLLARQRHGLASCMIAAFDTTQLTGLLGLDKPGHDGGHGPADPPAPQRPILVVALGAPAETPIVEPRRGDDARYWRDEQGRHHVPKLTAEEATL